MESNRKKLKMFDFEQDRANSGVDALANKSFEIDSIVFE